MESFATLLAGTALSGVIWLFTKTSQIDGIKEDLEYLRERVDGITDLLLNRTGSHKR